MTMRPKIIIGLLATLLLLFVALGLRIALLDVAVYRQQISATLQAENGWQLHWKSAAHWQAWPLGLQLGPLQVRDKDGLRLEARNVFVALGPRLLLQPEKSIKALQLQAINLYCASQAQMTGWSQLLQALLRDERLQATRLELLAVQYQCPAGSVAASQMSTWRIPALSLSPQQGGHHLQATLDYQWQDAEKQRSHAQLQMQGRLQASSTGLLLQHSQLRAELSSTRVPGQLQLQAAGAWQWQADTLSSAALKGELHYRHAAMAQDFVLPWQTALRVDMARGVLQLAALQAQAKTAAHAQLGIQAGLDYAWSQQRIRVQLQSLQWQSAAMALPLQLSATVNGEWPPTRGFRLQSADLRLRSGDWQAWGRFDMRRPAQPGAAPALTQALQLALSLHSPAADASALTLDMQPQAAGWQVQGRLQSRDWSVLARALALPVLAGRGQLAIQLQIPALTRQAWWQPRQGRVQIQAQALQLADYQPQKILLEKLQGYQSLLPELDAGSLQALQQAPGVIAQLDMTLLLQGPRLQTQALVLRLDKARLQGQGEFDRETQNMDYRLQLDLERSLFKPPAPAMSLLLRCQGNPEQEQMQFDEALAADCKLDEQAMNDLLAASLRRRFLDKQ